MPNGGRLPSSLAGVLETAERHPLLTIFLVALAVRVAFALGVMAFVRGPLIPDERQYMELLASVAEGRGAEAWVPGYGQALYDSTWVFSAPLAFFFRLFWPAKIIGQLYAACFGALTAVLTVRLALEAVSRRWALAAGLVVALFPSQVLWSSVVLRESLVWAALAATGLAVAVGAHASRRGVLVAEVAASAPLLALGRLRPQTLVVAVWALAVAAWFGRRHRVLRGSLGLAVAVLVPWVLGLGPVGFHLVQRAVPSLGTTRTNLSLEARSAFVPTTVVRPSGSGGAGAGPATRPLQGSTREVAGPGGERYVVEEGVGANVSHFPRGLVAVLFRPFPWQRPTSLALLLAQVESLLWYGLYALAGIGAWVRRRDPAVVAFPVVVFGAVTSVAALTHGNLGTAFRHRGQLLWLLAVLAAAGAGHVLARRRSP